MLVRLRNLSPDGIDVQFTLPPSVLRQGMKKGDVTAKLFDHPTECEFHLRPMNKDVYLEGAAQTKLHAVCDRCGEEFDQSFDVDLSLTLTPETKNEKRGGDTYQEADEGIVFFRNEEIDLGEVVREQILLSLPMRYLCKEDCLGLCEHCGANLNLGAHHCKVPPPKTK